MICHNTVPNGVARIPYANNFTRTSRTLFTGIAPEIAPDLARVAYMGLLGSSDKLNFECSTGNCTFPGNTTSFQTLALEPSCVDISPELKTEKPFAPDMKNIWYVPAFGNSSSNYSGTYYTFHKSIGREAFVRTEATSMTVPFFQYWPANRKFALFSFAALISTVDRKCVEVEFEKNSTRPDEGKCYGALAVECRLWPTIHTINARIDRSELREEIVDSAPLGYFHGYPNPYGRHLLESWQGFPKKIIRNGDWVSCNPSSRYSAETPMRIFNGTTFPFNLVSGLTESDIKWLPNDCVFSIPQQDGLGFSTFMDKMYMAQGMSGQNPRSSEATAGEVWIKALYEQGNATIDTVEAHVRKLAYAVNIHIRNFNSTNDQKTLYAVGSANSTDTCIQVQWAWLSYSIILVTLTIIFLGLTVWKTRRNRSPESARGVWKSSATAVMFCGLHEDIRKEHGAMEKSREMNHYADKIKVRLGYTDSGWRLR